MGDKMESASPGWDEMPAEMVDVAGEIGVRWTKKLLNNNAKCRRTGGLG